MSIFTVTTEDKGFVTYILKLCCILHQFIAKQDVVETASGSEADGVCQTLRYETPLPARSVQLEAFTPGSRIILCGRLVRNSLIVVQKVIVTELSSLQNCPEFDDKTVIEIVQQLSEPIIIDTFEVSEINEFYVQEWTSTGEGLDGRIEQIRVCSV